MGAAGRPGPERRLKALKIASPAIFRALSRYRTWGGACAFGWGLQDFHHRVNSFLDCGGPVGALPVLFNPVPMNFPAFRLSLLTLALTCAWGAQAATARTDIARPTDFAAQSVSQGPMVCQSSKVKTCGRRVAGKLGMPAGSAAKSAYRFVEEEFLFDSGVAIFLETAVPENRNAHAGWRRRLAFRKTAEGFQLVQVGIQYRCQGGSWQKEACGSASQLVRRKADGKGAPLAQAQAGGAAGRASSGAASAATQAGAAGAAAVTAAQAASGAGQDAPNRIVMVRIRPCGCCAPTARMPGCARPRLSRPSVPTNRKPCPRWMPAGVRVRMPSSRMRR